MKDDFISADTYAWGIGYYTMTIAIAAIFAGAVWMLVTKIIMKRKAKKTMVTMISNIKKNGAKQEANAIRLGPMLVLHFIKNGLMKDLISMDYGLQYFQVKVIESQSTLSTRVRMLFVLQTPPLKIVQCSKVSLCGQI